ncbi:GNAT family N-acetyltransferase [Leptolyngbya sp. PCC 6406]|uniref:GNAT family N-acetyltransferase n=1 Tax=Leptolyngbya sp. PCC 6406 TaxID=1173264 RepID=UPI0002AD1B32|nr:GNAT family N-acetyltransferase [Leptolyngbya sp. PCC 6406]
MENYQPPGYEFRQGNQRDSPAGPVFNQRALLLAIMGRTLAELGSDLGAAQIAHTIDTHLSTETPVWWVNALQPGGLPGNQTGSQPIACLWLGNAMDQRSGDRHAYVLLLYVDPDHRRRGIATTLLALGEAWARQRGDHQIGLQVYPDNTAALGLYQHQGYQTSALWMTKPL